MKKSEAMLDKHNTSASLLFGFRDYVICVGKAMACSGHTIIQSVNWPNYLNQAKDIMQISE